MTPVRFLILVSVAACTLGVACGSSKKTPAATEQPAGTVKGALALGQRATLPNAMTATLKAVEFPSTPKHGPSAAGAGDEIAALSVEVCAGSAQAMVTGFQFKLQLDDNTQAQVNLGEHDPAFINATLAPGQCNAGWVTFSVPTGKQPRYVTYQPQAGGDALAIWSAATPAPATH